MEKHVTWQTKICYKQKIMNRYLKKYRFKKQNKEKLTKTNLLQALSKICPMYSYKNRFFSKKYVQGYQLQGFFIDSKNIDDKTRDFWNFKDFRHFLDFQEFSRFFEILRCFFEDFKDFVLIC